jgi:hypothetical protein
MIRNIRATNKSTFFMKFLLISFVNYCPKSGNIFPASCLPGVYHFVHLERIISNMKIKIKTIHQFIQKIDEKDRGEWITECPV